jgi:hypothetical protein
VTGRLTDRQRTDRRLREIDFRRQIVGPRGLATALGWLHVGFRPAQTAHGWRTPGTGELAKGWPDLFLVRPRDARVLVLELKRQTERPTADQDWVLEQLALCGLDVMVVRPSDLEQLADVLR